MRKRRLFATKPSRAAKLRLALLAAGLALAAFWLGGFVVFVRSLPAPPPADAIETADAIVALTGGRDRLMAAMSLLTAHKGRRLLISGVHQATPRQDLKSLLDDPNDRFDCCVDVDRMARNTVGNAGETARWVRGHGFRSLIVVTAHYHMPRTLLELGHALPEIALTPYPVVPSSLGGKPWWHLKRARIFASEYTKYLLSAARIAFEDTVGADSPDAAGAVAAR